MGAPIHFEGVNFILSAPSDETLSVPVPVYRAADGTLLTCWLLTPEEIERVLQLRRVWIAMSGSPGFVAPLLTVGGRRRDLVGVSADVQGLDAVRTG